MKLSTNAQCQKRRLLDYLMEHGRINTVEARMKLDIMHPAARVQELREDGSNIVTYPRHVNEHKKVAEYVLLTT